MAQYTSADILFSATSDGLAGPGYTANQVTFTADGFNTVQRTRTTVVYTNDEWPVVGEIMRLSETNSDWHAGECSGMAWNPLSEVFSAVWIRTDQMSSQRYLQTRTIDPTGALGATQQVNQVIPGERPQSPGIACSSSSGRCLVAWTETEPMTWQNGIRTRLLDSDGVPIGSASGFLVNGFPDLPGASVRDVQYAGEQGFLVGWYHGDSSSPTGPDQHGRFVELGGDQPAYLEFPTFDTSDRDQWGPFACNDSGRCLIAVEINDGVDARLVTAWRAHIDGFEDGGFGGWDVVVGGPP